MFQTPREHRSFSGNIQGNRKPLCSFSNSLLTEISQLTDWLHWHARSLLCISLPSVKETSYYRKKPSENIPTTMYTCTQLTNAKNTNLIRKRDALALFLYLSPHLSKKQATAGKNPVNIPTNNEHLCTADHRYKQKIINLIWKTDTPALCPHCQAGARVQTKI
jgi:hypothetical protein